FCDLYRHTCLLGDQLVQTSQQSAAAGQGNAVVDNIRRQLRWSSLQGGTDGVEHRHHRICQSLAHLVRMQHHVLWQTVYQVSALDFHRLFVLIWISRADFDLDTLCGAVTDQEVVFFLDILNDGRVER